MKAMRVTNVLVFFVYKHDRLFLGGEVQIRHSRPRLLVLPL